MKYFGAFIKLGYLFSVLGILSVHSISAKEGGGKVAVANVELEILKEVPATEIKDQSSTSTCWSFSTLSMLESELLRMGKGEYDLSEMFIVRYTYQKKAEKYIRMHGTLNFGGGGSSNDVTDIITKYGIVPEQIYTGKKSVNDKHHHEQLDLELKEFVEKTVTEETVNNGQWQKKVMEIINSYLGTLPDTFSLNENKYTAETYYQSLGISPDNYIMISSYTHHPFYSNFVLEVPDNWSWGKVYNVPLDELTEIVDSAIFNEYSVVWATDVTEKGFNFSKGFALALEADLDKMTQVEQRKWKRMNEIQRDKAVYEFSIPVKEKFIDQTIRQQEFDSYLTTDDHGMHIIGIAKDSEGKKYYYVKNSWGVKNELNGYLFASEGYFRYKTISIMVHKDAVPLEISRKLGLK